ncbi:MAG: GNAT family N-acetyltransferase [Acidobacteriota bacterium]|nr:MAG: GNAT family N-acetyltransferase [Acidobacteriota bacterium]
MSDGEGRGGLGEAGVGFRRLEESDFPLLLEWLLLPHVREWWDEGEHTIEMVREAYGPEPGVSRFIGLLSDPDRRFPVPFGFFQYYRIDKETVGIDQFIGVPELVGKGLGTTAVRRFSEMIFGEIAPSRITLDPHPDNRRAIRCCEKAGFRHLKTETVANGEPAYLMELTRDAGEC